ncbi:MAG: hypothetical protein ACQEP1_05210 [Nanobdellota archaeon]
MNKTLNYILSTGVALTLSFNAFGQKDKDASMQKTMSSIDSVTANIEQFYDSLSVANSFDDTKQVRDSVIKEMVGDEGLEGKLEVYKGTLEVIKEHHPDLINNAKNFAEINNEILGYLKNETEDVTVNDLVEKVEGMKTFEKAVEEYCQDSTRTDTTKEVEKDTSRTGYDGQASVAGGFAGGNAKKVTAGYKQDFTDRDKFNFYATFNASLSGGSNSFPEGTEDWESGETNRSESKLNVEPKYDISAALGGSYQIGNLEISLEGGAKAGGFSTYKELTRMNENGRDVKTGQPEDVTALTPYLGAEVDVGFNDSIFGMFGKYERNFNEKPFNPNEAKLGFTIDVSGDNNYTKSGDNK